MDGEHQPDDEHLERLIDEARRLNATDFAAAHPELFFLVKRTVGKDQPQFNTEVPAKRGSNIQTGNIEVSIVTVAKSTRSPYQERISIGRARSCDIVIRDPSISKLHAYVIPSSNGAFSIVDVGSHNGTRVGPHVLSPHIAVPLRPGDLVLLGAVMAATLDAVGAHRAILQLMAGVPSRR